MSGVFFGVDSARDARSIIVPVHAGIGAFPAWWGRYLGDGGGAATPLSRAEATWVLANEGRLLPIYNDAGSADVAAGDDVGTDHGRRAAALAAAIGVPQGTWIPVDIESGWTPTGAFIAGYTIALASAGYCGGAYLNAGESSHVTAWRAARALSSVHAFLYSSEPEYDVWRDTVRDEWFDFSGLLGSLAGDVLAHQYAENELGDLVDFNLATTAGYGLLWHAGQPVAVRTSVKDACGLKHAPAHGGTNLAEIPAHGGILSSNKRDGDWVFVQWRDLYGWVLADNVN